MFDKRYNQRESLMALSDVSLRVIANKHLSKELVAAYIRDIQRSLMYCDDAILRGLIYGCEDECSIDHARTIAHAIVDMFERLI